MAGIFDFLFGSEGKFKKLDNFTPGQMNNLNQLTDLTGQAGQGASSVLDYLMQFMDSNSDVYKNFEQPYLNEFNQQTVPRLAEQYAGTGALSSSGFGQALGSAGSNLQTNLAALKSQLRQQAGQSILGQYNNQIGQSMGARPFDYQYQEGSSGFLPQFAGAALGALGGGGGLSSLLGMLPGLMGGGGGGNGLGRGSGNIGGRIG